jgi:LPXTG-site transpeptidase (sortase) family protein
VQNQSKAKDILYFGSIAVVTFLILWVVFSFFGVVPDSISLFEHPDDEDNIIINIDQSVVEYDASRTRPDRIVIPGVGVDAIINQPTSRDVATLDALLQQGAVHYPGSGSIEQGNMFIFAHSTGFSVVRNQAYKAFNDIEELNRGDIIQIGANGQWYEYRVTNVQLVDENSALVRFDNSKRTLTLSTCNTFGAKQERWVVEAEYTGRL